MYPSESITDSPYDLKCEEVISVEQWREEK
jgi:hypothetical protein